MRRRGPAPFAFDSPESVDRFWTQVDKTGDCWVWIGSTNQRGYGSLRRSGVHYLAHRFAWIIKFGPIADGLHVLHRCDNPPCVNPAHLFLGDDAANMQDAAGKGRIRGGTSRAASCGKGHLFAEHGRLDSLGRQMCRTCKNIAQRARRERGGR